jgi:hypothetical protein
MNPKHISKSGRISLTAMFSALTLIALYMAVLFPTFKFTLYFLSSVFVVGLLVEELPGMAVFLFLVVSLIGLIIIPIPYILPYILLFGHYGIVKYLLERRVSKAMAFLMKLLYFNICMAAIYFFLIRTEILMAGEIMDLMPLWALILVLQPVFFIYDFLYSKIALFYTKNIRKALRRL